VNSESGNDWAVAAATDRCRLGNFRMASLIPGYGELPSALGYTEPDKSVYAEQAELVHAPE